jgi:serine/threonine-protein kinase
VLNFLAWAQRRLGKWEEARESFLKAKELDPGEVSLNFIIGEHLSWMKRYDEAEKYFDLATELDPDDMYNILGLIQLYLTMDGDVVRARELLYETLERTGKDDILYAIIDNPTMQRILVFSDSLLVSRFACADRPLKRYMLYAEMYHQTGHMDLAQLYNDSLRVLLEGALEGLEETGPAASPNVSRLGFVYARMGMKEKAIEYGELAVEILPVSKDAVQGVVHLEKLAMIYALTGEHDRAFVLLDRLFDMSVSILLSPEILRLDPLWDPIREDPRFDKIIEKYSGRY